LRTSSLRVSAGFSRRSVVCEASVRFAALCAPGTRFTVLMRLANQRLAST
jgi:hypothetical protein